jgi:hypothetical protein
MIFIRIRRSEKVQRQTHKLISGLNRTRLLKVWGLVLFSTIFLVACSSAETGLSVGDSAPEFTLSAEDGSTVSLSEYEGEQPVLLYFHMALG